MWLQIGYYSAGSLVVSLVAGVELHIVENIDIHHAAVLEGADHTDALAGNHHAAYLGISFPIHHVQMMCS